MITRGQHRARLPLLEEAGRGTSRLGITVWALEQQAGHLLNFEGSNLNQLRPRPQDEVARAATWAGACCAARWRQQGGGHELSCGMRCMLIMHV